MAVASERVHRLGRANCRLHDDPGSIEATEGPTMRFMIVISVSAMFSQLAPDT
jgi:hypothetical protein